MSLNNALNQTVVRKALAILLFIGWPLVMVFAILMLLVAWFFIPFGYVQRSGEDRAWSWTRVRNEFTRTSVSSVMSKETKYILHLVVFALSSGVGIHMIARLEFFWVGVVLMAIAFYCAVHLVSNFKS